MGTSQWYPYFLEYTVPVTKYAVSAICFLCMERINRLFEKENNSVQLELVGAQERVAMLVCEGTVDDYSMDCTADMNAQWEDLAAVLNLSSVQEVHLEVRIEPMFMAFLTHLFLFV